MLDRFGLAMSILSKHRLLVVDSDLDYVGRLMAVLGRDFEIFSLAHPSEVLQNFQIICPDLVILEMDLPEMDGFKLVSTIRRSTNIKRVPCVFLTLRNKPVDMRLGYMVGAAMCLSKRAELERIAMNIRVYIRENSIPLHEKPYSLTDLRILNKKCLEASARDSVAAVEKIKPPPSPPSASSIDSGPSNEGESKISTWRNHPRVLIGEVNYAITFALESLLQDSFNCIATGSGVEALDKAERYLPDFLILNMRMPHVPGFEVCKMLREHRDFRHVPIFGTFKADDPLRRDYVSRYGLTGVYLAPEEIDQLVLKIKDLAIQPDFTPQKYPQPFEQVYADEERDRVHHERSDAVSEKIRREKTFQDFFKTTKF